MAYILTARNVPASALMCQMSHLSGPGPLIGYRLLVREPDITSNQQLTTSNQQPATRSGNQQPATKNGD